MKYLIYQVSTILSYVERGDSCKTPHNNENYSLYIRQVWSGIQYFSSRRVVNINELLNFQCFINCCYSYLNTPLHKKYSYIWINFVLFFLSNFIQQIINIQQKFLLFQPMSCIVDANERIYKINTYLWIHLLWFNKKHIKLIYSPI